MLRRSFLKGIGLGSGALVSLPFLGLATLTYEEAVAGIIKNELGYLNLNQPGIAQFIADFSKDKDDFHRVKTRAMYLAGSKPENFGTVDMIVRTYLLSSDFFINKMDERQQINYVALYQPYKRPCANPFSFIYYPSTVS